MLVALALYTSTAHAGIPPDSAERRASVRMQTSLTEDQRAKSGRDRRPREEPFTATPSTCSGPDSPCIVPSEYGIQLPVFVAGALALGMNEAAYLSEVVRSGLMSVDRGQREAAQGALYRGPPEEVPRAEAPSPRAMDARRNRVARPGCCCDLLGTRLRLRREYGWRERVLSGRGVLRRRLSCLDVPQLAHVLHERLEWRAVPRGAPDAAPAPARLSARARRR